MTTPTVVTRTHLYFALPSEPRYNRASWEARLKDWTTAGAGKVVVVSDPESADWIVETASIHALNGGRIFTLSSASQARRFPKRTFAWDGGDFPTGLLPGLYCSLPRGLYDPARHRSFCYPFRYNPYITALPLEDARHLFGFVGEITSGLRARIFDRLSACTHDGTALLHRQPSLFTRLANEDSEGPKRSYVEAMRRSRFFLCPRGNGVSSVRLFETLEAGRVPVILSDDLVLPQCVDWSRCAVIVPERRLEDVPAILAERQPEWPVLAQNARAEWERNFSDANLLGTLGRELETLAGNPGRTPVARRFQYLRRVAPAYGVSRLKAAARWIQSLPRRICRLGR